MSTPPKKAISAALSLIVAAIPLIIGIIFAILVGYMIADIY